MPGSQSPIEGARTAVPLIADLARPMAALQPPSGIATAESVGTAAVLLMMQRTVADLAARVGVLEAAEAARRTKALLELRCDALQVVARHLAPNDVGQLMQTCRALAGTVARDREWVWLRALVRASGWPKACAAAAMDGHMAALRWAHAQGTGWEAHVCVAAAVGGRVEVLQWLRAKAPPCPWDESVCALAARNGHLDVLQFLRAEEPPCPWDEATCMAAAEFGHLELLRWLRSQTPPCPWNAPNCLWQAGLHDLSILGELAALSQEDRLAHENDRARVEPSPERVDFFPGFSPAHHAFQLARRQ